MLKGSFTRAPSAVRVKRHLLTFFINNELCADSLYKVNGCPLAIQTRPYSLKGGCVDSVNQSLVMLLMTLGQQDVSKVLLGPLSPYTIEFLRHLRSFFQIMFKIESKTYEERKGAEKVLLTCVGVGFSNLSKTIT